MSNGDDVLDNWEEIDEDGLKSTVEKLKSSSASSASCEKIRNNSYQSIVSATFLTTTNSTTITGNTKPIPMKLLQRSPNQDSTSSSKTSAKSPLDNMSTTFQPVMMVLHKPEDEYHSANYAPPIANQTVKILRRPTQSTEPRNNGIRPKQPLKTLQQREQEYAEARLRILGSAKNPEDEEHRTIMTCATTSAQTFTMNSTPSTPTVTAAALSNNSYTNMVSSNSKINSPKLLGGPNQYNNHYNQQLQQQQHYQQNFQPHQQQQQQQQQNYFYNQQQQSQTPAYNNNNRTYSMNPLLGLGPMGAIGQPAQYQASTLSSPQTSQQQPPQQHLKYQQIQQKSPQQQQQQQQQHNKPQQQTWSPVVGGSVSSSSVRQQSNDTILRLPRGPDGTTGFQIRR